MRREREATAPVADGRAGGPSLTVVYTGEQDEVYDFPAEGCRRTFGRDDERCDIVVWSALNGSDLARVAGVVFRMDGELWLRNLALSHALRVQVPGRPPEPDLPPRRSDADRGPARSLPGPVCTVLGPDGCELLVRQEAHPRPDPAGRAGVLPGSPTRFEVPAVPDHLRAVAVAVCAPLLRGERFPASYSEVAVTLRLRSARTARRLVDELCDCCAPAHPVPGERPPGDRRTLRLPAYYDLAHVLVAHHRIDTDDLRLLPSPPTDGTARS
ncbi:hypothetical protein [Kineococcus rhizosphaerae]|uniref:FHA domain-containing protein n=1 Tax=Kineococcus rhizosphaerae TaxID=559628 RepID=A0A2T0R7U3_9ACTN|nr:hypothetical protein [Kineococcus rhizosphaerae]PRY17210.1 hypothetical protein CLV37_102169 [Kineococcus rhizosphaerae]